MEKWLVKNVWSRLPEQPVNVSQEHLLLAQEWVEFLNLSPFLQQKLLNLLESVNNARQTAVVFPRQADLMRWSYLTVPQDIRVIILGQDPYHQPGQATGLAFSVSRGVTVPPSLRNIFREVGASTPGFRAPPHGCLEAWSKQGVLLLNTILSVERGKPGSHEELGWAWFTNYVISTISEKLKDCVFMLWGSKAVAKANLINSQKHLVLKAGHPSPLAARSLQRSAWPAFTGCGHFKTANEYLEKHGRGTIDWSLV